MTKHTPIPWEAIDADERFPLDWPCGELAIYDGDGGYIAKVMCHTDEATTRANARLIEVAPGLLALAQRIVDNAGTVCGLTNREAAEIEAWEDLARAAIANAEGGNR